jgi:hypothetical protein
MIEMTNDTLAFSFPEVHPQAVLRIDFQRTLRIPDDGKSYPLPPGLGRFPLRHVDDFATTVPSGWIGHGGVLLPMYQAEALWLHFLPGTVLDRSVSYPFAIKVATGKINAVSGKPWADGLNRDPQDYVVAPGQPWLDGFCVKKGLIRQFVAMPLGAGYTAEEQITGQAEHGGLQIMAYPMKREVFERRFPVGLLRDQMRFRKLRAGVAAGMEMGLAPGGLMRQQIYRDRFDPDDWDLSHRGRCFVHIANSLVWRAITGGNPPTPPPTAKQYTRAGLPWFEYYSESQKPLDGSALLGGLESVAAMGQRKGDVPLPENESTDPGLVVKLRAGLTKDQVREGTF